MSANVETMMYVGERPWHRLGIKREALATATEALATGLDWGVATEPAYDRRGNEIPGIRALVRTDRETPLGGVGTGYQPIQNFEAASFLDHIVGEGRAIFETAGSLSGGRQVWFLARLPGDIWVTKEDNVRKYLLLTNPHRQGHALLVLWTPIRVVCENTLRAALREGLSHAFRVRHVGDIRSKIEEARRLLGISFKYFDTFQEQSQAFAHRSLTREALKMYFEALVPDPKNVDPSRAGATRENLVRLFEVGKGNDLPTVRGTLWSAVNAVAEFIDHERPTRTPKGEDASVKRFESAQFGSGAQFRSRAWQLALKIA
jgi:phage/plasmid-like protein (TIGR03299 family)